ncbi:MAG: HD-GYP domain-containing protein [Butyrivibrio sp.]|nr:HD-GYP domain-containing protein [Butyrivibrio sp.]
MKKLAKLRICSDSHNMPKIGYFILIGLYLIASRTTSHFASSSEVVVLGQMHLPLNSFVGVIASLASVIIIFMVVFYGRIGFYTGTIIIVIRGFILLDHIIFSHNIQSIPGIFTNLMTFLAIALIQRRNNRIDKFKESEITHLKEQQKFSQRLFEQTATALVSAIDAKDEYSRGHSQRVADYSEKIARYLGKSEEDCRKIYYAALLHDVGKIGISDNIINKHGEPTEEEYEVIMQHPIIGEQILSSITEYPYLSIGARYHHERYDGKGYPEGLKGEDIPEIARIIAVADTYDAMTSSRSYRSALPQLVAREEIVKGAGTQFDPYIVRIMQHVIDLDLEYIEREKAAIKELSGKSELVCKEFRDEISSGIRVTYYRMNLQFKCRMDDAEGTGRGPAILLFDSFDGRYHNDETTMRDLCYYEFCEIWLDGTTKGAGVRKIETSITAHDTGAIQDANQSGADVVYYNIEAVKRKDHAQITIDDGSKIIKHIIALPDSSRFVYLAITGENCTISDVKIESTQDMIPEDYIPRIAEKISYIDVPEGDVPNVQIDSYRTAATRGIPIVDGMELNFHTMSLPTATLIWHCAYIVIFYSKDGEINGEDYREYALIRLDGEYWDTDKGADNKLVVNTNDKFEGWDKWKAANKKGLDCRVFFKRKDNEFVVTTENQGLFIKNTTIINEMPEKVYVALSGDECALTNIKVIA